MQVGRSAALVVVLLFSCSRTWAALLSASNNLALPQVTQSLATGGLLAGNNADFHRNRRKPVLLTALNPSEGLNASQVDGWVIADFNGDGYRDLVVVTHTPKLVTIWQALGSKTGLGDLTIATTLNQTSRGDWRVLADDING